MKSNFSLANSYQKHHTCFLLLTSTLICCSLLLCMLMLLLGNTHYSLSTIVRVLSGETIQGATFAIRTLRLPRMLAALLAGLAFGIAGHTFQTLLRNPLASPDIIGITSGSSMAAIFCILVLHLSGSIVSIASVACGLLITILIYFLARGNQFSGGRLILIGIGVQAIINAIISYLLLNATQNDVPAAIRWMSGSLNGIQMVEIPTLFAIVLLFGFVITLLGNHLRILELGEQTAISLGVRTNIVRVTLILSSVFLIAFATAITGPIAFVAFLSGPISAKLPGNIESNTIIAGLTGAILVLLSDLIGQYAFPIKFPVGIITGILGAPYLLFLLIRMYRAGGMP